MIYLIFLHMLLFIKDSNLPRAKFSPGLSATLLQWTVLLNLGQVSPETYCKRTEKWEVLPLLGRFFWGEGFFPLSRFFLLLLFFWRTASGIYKEKKKKRQQDPKDGNYEEGGMLGWFLKQEAQLLLHRLCLHCYWLKSRNCWNGENPSSSLLENLWVFFFPWEHVLSSGGFFLTWVGVDHLMGWRKRT